MIKDHSMTATVHSTTGGPMKTGPPLPNAPNRWSTSTRYWHPRKRQSTTSTVNSPWARISARSEEHTSELQSRGHLVCRLLLEKKKTKYCSMQYISSLTACYSYTYQNVTRSLHDALPIWRRCTQQLVDR